METFSWKYLSFSLFLFGLETDMMWVRDEILTFPLMITHSSLLSVSILITLHCLWTRHQEGKLRKVSLWKVDYCSSGLSTVPCPAQHGCIFFPKILIFHCRKSLSFPGSISSKLHLKSLSFPSSGQRFSKILIFP